nr:tRNA preQ1(34) S-adenosylmethionine ribosyltransferase-isomerase QueA [bacterium]
MKLDDFNYNLPHKLIAQKSIKPRDHSKLMVISRKKKSIEDKRFFNILEYLNKGDVLVLNNTKVFPARLIGKRKDTGGKVEIFLLNSITSNKWHVLIGNKRKKVGQVISFAKDLECIIEKQVDESIWLVKFNKQGNILNKLIDDIGQVPTPPYINIPEAKKKSKSLKEEYQTVYATNRGSVAAPTAGFHFTKSLINRLKKKGIKFEYVTLHVGFGTFEPIKIDNVKKHKMHSELAMIDKKTATSLNKAKKDNKRIIAVGTTTVRTLEAFSVKNKISSGSKQVTIFIYPGYKFKFVDALITNFHLPKSTLLMLVSAFSSRPFILKIYNIAVKKKYRFFSFGDAMFIE